MAFSPAVRGPVKTETLIWFKAKNRDTGAPEFVGFWTGREDKVFTIDGEQRTYKAGAIKEVGNIVSEAGLDVISHDVTLSALNEWVQTLLRGYESRAAEVEIHSVRFEPGTKIIQTIDLALEGKLNKVGESARQEGGVASVNCAFVTSARRLTKGLPLLKSHTQQQRRNNDQINKYSDISGTVDIFWGMERVEK